MFRFLVIILQEFKLNVQCSVASPPHLLLKSKRSSTYSHYCLEIGRVAVVTWKSFSQGAQLVLNVRQEMRRKMCVQLSMCTFKMECYTIPKSDISLLYIIVSYSHGFENVIRSQLIEIYTNQMSDQYCSSNNWSS